MSLENADQPPPESLLEAMPDSQVIRKLKISYTREYLLSFSDLDICKKLPHGFDSSNLSELEDASSAGPDRQRGQGGFLLQGSKRGDYGAPMARLEGSGSYSRGSSGRWDTRSSGSNDWEGDSQNEREAFITDKRFGSQYRHQWQNNEHDGLLGSGAFPRPSGYTGVSAPKARGSGQYQLNRTTEPYQPPRPYKAIPFQRKDHIDSCNDETFGSAECSSENRTEEERKRRASFELMRKEQQKALQEKKKQIPDNPKEKLSDDITSLFHNSTDQKTRVNKIEKPDEAVTSSASQSDASRNSVVAPAPASRPLVPPGFASALVEKKLCRQSSNSSLESEPRNVVFEENLQLDGLSSSQEKGKQSASVINIFKNEIKTTSVDIGDEAQKLSSLSLSSGEVVGSSASSLVKVDEVWKDKIADGCSQEQESSSKMTGSAGPDHAVSILEQFFGNALSKGSGSSPKHAENQCLRADEEILHPARPESSKFAHWFLKDDINPVEDFSSKGLLSLIVKNEEVAPLPSSTDVTAFQRTSSISPAENIDSVSNLLAPPEPTSAVGIPEHLHQSDTLGSSPAVLTCEDLEQFMLAEASNSSSNPQLPAQAHRAPVNAETPEQKADVDDHASQHLLSLLQKGKGTREQASLSPTLHMGSAELVTSDLSGTIDSGSGKSLTLEALFGAAFMNELHSMETPISTWRPSVGGPNYNDGPLPHGHMGQHMQKGHAFDLLRTGIEHGSSTQNANVGSGSFDERGLEIHLPEEESLFTLNDSLNSHPPDALSLRSTNKNEEVSSKLLNSVPRDMEHLQMLGPDDLSDIRGPPDQVGSDNLHRLLLGRSSELPHQMAHTRHIFQQLDADMNQQSKLIAPEAVRHDPRHPLAVNLIPHRAFPTAGGPRFDPAAHHLMLQHMPLAENFAPPYPVHGLPRGVSASHPMHQIPGYIPELNNVNSFPMHHRHLSYGQGMPMPGPAAGDIRGSHPHPEALERLIQMELRARSKQAHPAMAGHVSGTYVPELDMNFRYR